MNYTSLWHVFLYFDKLSNRLRELSKENALTVRNETRGAKTVTQSVARSDPQVSEKQVAVGVIVV